MTTHTEETTDTMEGGPQRLADAAGGIAEEATSVAEQHASSTMTQVGDTIEQVARAVRSSAEQLRNDQPQIANFVDIAAERAEGAAQFLRQHEARDVLNEAQDFARRQPAVVIGAGLAFGLLVGRAIRSAGPSEPRGTHGGRAYSDADRGVYGASSSRSTEYGETEYGNRYAAAGSNGGSRGPSGVDTTEVSSASGHAAANVFTERGDAESGAWAGDTETER
jgi:ElaB/YqjD/DUF883 family membrane-anchored ribosome-binding protein